MDKKSRQILKYMRSGNVVHRHEIIRHFGETYIPSLDYLLQAGYLTPVHASQNYRITGLGLGFLEQYLPDQFLRWAPFCISLYAALISTLTALFR